CTAVRNNRTLVSAARRCRLPNSLRCGRSSAASASTTAENPDVLLLDIGDLYPYSTDSHLFKTNSKYLSSDGPDKQGDGRRVHFSNADSNPGFCHGEKLHWILLAFLTR